MLHNREENAFSAKLFTTLLGLQKKKSDPAVSTDFKLGGKLHLFVINDVIFVSFEVVVQVAYV